MNKVLKVYEDDKYSIILTNNHWKSTVIQLCTHYPKTVIKPEGAVEECSTQVAWQKEVDLISYSQEKKVVPRNANDYRKEVVEALAEAKHQMANLQKIEQMFEGVVKDFESQLNAAGKAQK